jgi:Glycosyl transferase family 90
MKKFSSLAPPSVRRRFLEFRIARSVPTATVALRLEPDAGCTSLADLTGSVPLEFARSDDEIQVLVPENFVENRYLYRLLYGRIPTFLRVFAGVQNSVRRAIADIGDGINVPADALCFCANRDDALLIPDVYFVGTDAFSWARKLAATLPAWSERSNPIVWRGSPTGLGAIAADDMRPENCDLNLRVRVCLKLKGVGDVDAKLVKVRRRTLGPQKAVLAESRIVGEKIRESSWARRKFAIDVDGFTNTWSNFYVRLLLGCCVIKVGSPLGYRQWYYDKIEPWVHFVPVRADLSDLIERIDWCRSHENECREIARAGQEFALQRTVKTELTDAIARVDAALG